MRYGSVCSGIEAASVAWIPLGWTCSFMSEIEPFPLAVLTHRFPGVPIHGDFTTIQAGQYADIDVLIGGTPCQSFSVAGLRGGMGDARGNLALEFMRLVSRLRPRWVVWENVPGCLSSNEGRDFGSIIGALGELGYGVAYRILDAQNFGVPQRRRRVFVIGHLGDWQRAAAVLFEPASLRRNPEASGKTKSISATLTAHSAGAGCGADDNTAAGNQLVASTLLSSESHGPSCESTLIPQRVTPTLTASCMQRTGNNQDAFVVPMAYAIRNDALRNDREDATSHEQTGLKISENVAPTLDTGTPHAVAYCTVTHTLRGEGFDASEDGTGRGIPLVPMAFTLNDHLQDIGHNVSPTLKVFSKVATTTEYAVRRLIPVEVERLQGFPDDFTLVPFRKGQSADGPRYKAAGNSMATVVIAWLGKRMKMVDAIPCEHTS